MDQYRVHVGLGFNKKDSFNYIEQQKHVKIKDGYVRALLIYLQGKADNDAMFFAKYMLIEDGKLNHIFSVDVTSRIDHKCFGDVIVFDSTYKKNKYKKSLVIFLGKNHHAQLVIFGCTFVSYETTKKYKRVLESFFCCNVQQASKSHYNKWSRCNKGGDQACFSKHMS